MDRSPSLRPVLAEITVVAFEDPVVEHLGHRPGSAYIELCYLPVLGPSTTWLWQRLSRLAAAAPSTAVDAGDLALSLGLGNGLGAHAPLPRSLSRLVQFDCAYRAGEVFAVRRALPDLPARRLGRLPWSARQAHDRIVASRSTGGR